MRKRQCNRLVVFLVALHYWQNYRITFVQERKKLDYRLNVLNKLFKHRNIESIHVEYFRASYSSSLKSGLIKINWQIVNGFKRLHSLVPYKINNCVQKRLFSCLNICFLFFYFKLFLFGAWYFVSMPLVGSLAPFSNIPINVHWNFVLALLAYTKWQPSKVDIKNKSKKKTRAYCRVCVVYLCNSYVYIIHICMG